jgi:hypothetical protein
MEKEMPKENEIWCRYCGPGWDAVWEVVTDAGQIAVCNDHHFILRQIHAVGVERLIGEEHWKDVTYSKAEDLDTQKREDLGDWKDLV